MNTQLSIWGRSVALTALLGAALLAPQGSLARAATITGTVYFDRDNTGTVTPGDDIEAPHPVQLLDSGGNLLQTAVGPLGVPGSVPSYTFSNLPAGTYTIRFASPLSVTATKYITDSSYGPVGGSASKTLTVGATTVSSGNDFLFTTFGKAVVCGDVLLDLDCDGIMDPGEPKLAGITLQLIAPDGTVAASTLSTASAPNTPGFDLVAPPGGYYDLVVLPPAGYVVSGAFITDPSIARVLSSTRIRVSTPYPEIFSKEGFLLCPVTPPPPPPGNGGTRTQGYFKNHQDAREDALSDCGPFLLGTLTNGVVIDEDRDAYDILWSNVAKLSDGTHRTALGQARIKLAHQLLTAQFNACLFGPAPGSNILSLLDQANAALAGTNVLLINTLQGALDLYNNRGDAIAFPGSVQYDNAKGDGNTSSIADGNFFK